MKHPNSNRHYIGITSRTCQKRLWDHLCDNDKNKKIAWIKSHAESKKDFYMEPMFYVQNWELAKKLEIYWIAEDRRAFGYDMIMNGTDGGDGRLECTPETRLKISKATKGKKRSAEAKINMSRAQSGENNPNFGKIKGPISDETRIKISKSLTGKMATQETREKMSKSRIGIKCKDETKIKIAESQRKLSNDQIPIMLKMLDNGQTLSQVGSFFDVHLTTIWTTRKRIKEINDMKMRQL